MLRRADVDKGLGAAPMAATSAARSIVITRDLSFGDGNAKPKGDVAAGSAGTFPGCVRSAPACRQASYRLGAWFNKAAVDGAPLRPPPARRQAPLSAIAVTASGAFR